MNTSVTWNTASGVLKNGLGRHSRLRNLAGSNANHAWAYLLAGFLIGLVIGLPILGWWLWPVRVSNAVPKDLARTYQDAYVAMVADSYALNGDQRLAEARLSSWDQATVAEILLRLEAVAEEAGSPVQAKRLAQLREDLALRAPATVSSDSNAPAGRESSPGGSLQPSMGHFPFIPLLALGGGVLLIVVAFVLHQRTDFLPVTQALSQLRVAGLRIRRGRSSRRTRRASLLGLEETPAHIGEDQLGERSASAVEVDVGQDQPAIEDEDISLDEALSLLSEEIEVELEDDELEQTSEPSGMGESLEEAKGEVLDTFLATYRHGTGDLFDTAFSIETDDGEFLGECGVGVAETIDESSPEKVCALELWLFDKGDIRTTTKVIVSEYAMRDAELRDSLSGRGDLVVAEEGKAVVLQTAGLILRAEVSGLEYAESTDAPPKSYFEEVQLELTSIQRSRE